MIKSEQSNETFFCYGIRNKYGALRNERFFVKPELSVLTDGETIATIKVVKTTTTTYQEVEDEFQD